MKRPVIFVSALIVVLIVAVIGYKLSVHTDPVDVPPVPAASSEVVTPTPTTGTEATATPTDPDGVTDPSDILMIEVAGSVTGIIEIELLKDIAPFHAARLRELARSGAYDNVVFHRVIDGFMAQTGDVQFGKREGDSTDLAGRGGSDKPDLVAEFSDTGFVRGIVGMARSTSPNSANSQFFIMFDNASFLDGQYTVVGRIIAGQDIVDAIKKGDPAQEGKVDGPDFMKKVWVKSDG